MSSKRSSIDQQLHIPEHQCQAFRNCISNYINRKKRRLEKKLLSRKQPSQLSLLVLESYRKKCKLVHHLVNHACMILKTLSIKRHSLLIAIEAFREICTDCIAVLGKTVRSALRNGGNDREFSSILQQVLMHIFIQYIHIRDGFVLLTSGECRHTADSALRRQQENIKRREKSCNSGSSNNNSSSHDISRLDENSFSSQLSQVRLRSDGYTTLYNSKNGYSGYGWDEFFNEEVGVKRRLLDALRSLPHVNNKNEAANIDDSEDENSNDDDNKDSIKAKKEREKIWDVLSELGGAEMFEAAFDSHDSMKNDLEQKLESYRKRVLTDIQKLLTSFAAKEIPTPAGVLASSKSLSIPKPKGNIVLSMVTKDKFEKLEVSNAKGIGFETWKIERQGDAFKGKDKRGALPSRITLNDWLNIMKLPPKLQDIHQATNRSIGVGRGRSEKSANNPRPKKKRLVIQDSDDESDNDSDRRKPNDNGLKVTFKEVEEDKNESLSSLHDIKKRCGIDSDELQRSREGLEEEERMSKKAAFVDEIGQGAVNEEGMVVTTSTSENHVEKDSNNEPQEAIGTGGYFHDEETEIKLSFLGSSHHANNSAKLSRNDLLRNATVPRSKEPTERITIGSNNRNSRNDSSANVKNHSSINCGNDKAFNAFPSRHTNDDMEEESVPSGVDETRNNIQYRKWGDEVLEDLGRKVNSFPACAPERPPEMLRELGLEQEP